MFSILRKPYRFIGSFILCLLWIVKARSFLFPYISEFVRAEDRECHGQDAHIQFDCGCMGCSCRIGLCTSFWYKRSCVACFFAFEGRGCACRSRNQRRASQCCLWTQWQGSLSSPAHYPACITNWIHSCCNERFFPLVFTLLAFIHPLLQILSTWQIRTHCA